MLRGGGELLGLGKFVGFLYIFQRIEELDMGVQRSMGRVELIYGIFIYFVYNFCEKLFVIFVKMNFGAVH